MPTSSARPSRTSGRPLLLVGTKKGAFFLHGDPSRRKWRLDGPRFLGHVVHHVLLDPRDGRTMLLAAKTGHLGPTVFRSTDGGKSWKEASRPPAFPKAPEGEKGYAVDHVFFLAPGHPSEPGVWYAGTSPHGLFRSEDGGATWEGVKGFNEHPMRMTWFEQPGTGTPDGPKTHSILVDPRDRRRLYVGLSGGGIFESVDGGVEWRPLNRGVAADFLPVKDAEYGHDPHSVKLHPLRPDRLYHQNHCGIYRIDRPAERWERIGKNMPPKAGDIGFPIVLHPRDPETLWVFPMDGTEVWPRTSPGGKPAVYRSRNGGRSWQRFARGLPPKDAWFTVLRQAMTCDGGEPLGLYFGTTSGEIWASRNEGDSWTRIAAHLPYVYCVEAGQRLG